MFFDDVPLPHRLTVTELRRNIRKQPRELLWRQLFVGCFGRYDVRHRKMRLEAWVALLRNDRSREDMTSIASHFPSWSWKEAQTVISALSLVPAGARNWATAQFLGLICGSHDRPAIGLAAAREALDAVPLSLRRRDPGDWASLEGLVLAQQDPRTFLARFPELMRALETEPLLAHRLCDWAVRAQPGGPVELRLRSVLDSLPTHARDSHGEVRLALRDARMAITAKNRGPLQEAIRRLERFTPGAKYLHSEVLSLARELVRAAQLPGPSHRLLTRLLPTAEGPGAGRLLRRLGRAR